MALSKQRLSDLRAIMQKEGIQGYIVPSADAHQSEYTPDQDKQRQYISGFTGSAGLAVVGEHKAWLWTDGRYWNQAGLELSEDWELMKQGLPTTPLPEEFVAKNLPAGSSTGVDPRLLSIPQANDWSAALQKSNQHLKFIPHNLVDQVWKDKPQPCIKHCIVLSEKLAGRSVNDKLEWIRKEITNKKCDLLIITALDEIAWLLNIRGFDILYNPVLISYAIISLKDVKIYVDHRKLSDEVKSHFAQHSIIPLEYSTFFSDLEKLAATKLNIWVDANSSIAVYNALKPELNKNERFVIVDKSPIILEKALKNPVELNVSEKVLQEMLLH
jgi:Xaa-Pro aminopeptidase